MVERISNLELGGSRFESHLCHLKILPQGGK